MADEQELVEILQRWRTSSETHETRFLLLIDKHIEILRQWVALVKETPVDSTEFAVGVVDLWKQNKVLIEQFQEVIHSMAEDRGILAEFFEKKSLSMRRRNDNS